MLLMRVWDAPTRLFHAAVVLLLALGFVSVQREWTQVHFLSGYTLLALLLFRLAWGFVGSETSRFRQYMRNPLAGLRHLAVFSKLEPDTEIGHNAAGGWLVLAMLLALFVHAVTGLFSDNGAGVAGPLADWVGPPARVWLTGLHAWSLNVVLALTVLHIGIISAYAAVKRRGLLRVMVTGKKRLPANMRQPRFASSLVATAILAGAAAVVWALVSFG